MKKLFLLLIILSSLFISSCNACNGDEQNNEQNNEQDLKKFYDNNVELAAKIFENNLGELFFDVEYKYLERDEIKSSDFYKYNCQSLVAFDVITTQKVYTYYGVWEFENSTDANSFLQYINELSGYQRCLVQDNIVFENSVTYYYLLEDYKVVDDYILSKDGLTFIGLKDGLTSESIEIVLPSQIENVAGYALGIRGEGSDYFLKVKKVICNQNLKKIGAFAFFDLFYLDELVLNEGLENIFMGAFSAIYRKNVIDVVIPSTVKNIGQGSFEFMNMFVNAFNGEQLWDNTVIQGQNVNIYYKDMWEYNTDGNPVLIEK